MFKLRDYQIAGLDGIRAKYFVCKRVLYVLPCRGGKTLIFGTIAHGLMQKKNRSYILVHRQQLLRQASRMLKSLGVPHGVLSGEDKRGWKEPIIVATIQTLARHLGKLPEPNLIVCDEAHRSVASTYRKVFDHWPNAFVLGVTATPLRNDGKSLGNFYGDMVLGPSEKALMEQGYLSKYVAYAPPHTPDLSHVKIRAGDYDTQELEDIYDKPTVMGDVISHYRRLANGLPAIAFCVSVKAAQDLAQEFRNAGYSAVSVDGNMEDYRKREAIDGLASGKYHVVTSCELISEGVDVPVCAVAILVRPTKSLALAIQQMCRPLTPVYCDGMPLDTPEQRHAAMAAGRKPHAIILDHAGVIKEHGFPDDVREWTLDEQPKKKRKSNQTPAIRMRHCSQCEAIHKPAPACPRCGYVYPSAGREIEYVEGELVQLTDIDKKRMFEERKQAIRMARTEDQLREVAKRYGYKEGWVFYMMKARGGKLSTKGAI